MRSFDRSKERITHPGVVQACRMTGYRSRYLWRMWHLPRLDDESDFLVLFVCPGQHEIDHRWWWMHTEHRHDDHRWRALIGRLELRSGTSMAATTLARCNTGITLGEVNASINVHSPKNCRYKDLMKVNLRKDDIENAIFISDTRKAQM